MSHFVVWRIFYESEVISGGLQLAVDTHGLNAFVVVIVLPVTDATVYSRVEAIS